MGTDAQATTAGTTADPDGDEPPIRFRGDELYLYGEFHHDLVRKLGRNVRANHQDVEDACAFAWIQFFRCQPDRDREWKGRLYRTAQREAWRLTASHGRELRIVPELSERGPGDVKEPADPHDRIDERLEFLAAMEEVRRLPERMQQAVIVRSQVYRQADVAAILGISPARVGHLLQSVSAKMREISERRIDRERPVASPHAARLRELEDEPPKWLRQAIGRPPARNKSASATVLAWRRAALIVDDYRRDHGWRSPDVALGPQPSEPAARRAHDRAQHAANQVRDERLRQRGLLRER